MTQGQDKSIGRITGACIQGLILGGLLMVAVVQLASSELGARIFRYQGF